MTKSVKLERISTLTGSALLKNTTVLGSDTSVHSTGLAVVRSTEDSVIVDLTHIIQVPKDAQDLDAINIFADQLEDFKRSVIGKHKIDKLIIEDTFFSQNVNVLKKLTRHGVLVYDRFRSVVKSAELMMPTSARNRIGFKASIPKLPSPKLKKEIMKYIGDLLNIEVTQNDIGDALVLALAGLAVKE